MTTHIFHPDHYFSTIGPHTPVLEIAPGDRVITTTIDARGKDASGVEVISSGNPMTGPFFITGAEPGDSLAVRLEAIVPNRAEGWSSIRLAPNVVDPAFFEEEELAKEEDRQPAAWMLDTAAWTARLKSPETRLGAICLPLAPMLGCFGVAPAGNQAISTATSGEFGGNMDYRGFRAGTTVYFPVFAPGALFFLGDGHAAQGDGEIAGTGIEVSMDVTFQVKLLKSQEISWPRAENERYILTVGNARPLDQALQHATSEMARWLTTDYGLDLPGAALLMGQAVEYEVGNVFDPAYTMVCKLAKDRLPDRIARQ